MGIKSLFASEGADVEGDSSNVAVGEEVDVTVLMLIKEGLLTAQPVVGVPLWVGPLMGGLAPKGLPLASEADALDGAEGFEGKIYI